MFFIPMIEDVTELTFQNGRFDGSGSALVLGGMAVEFEFVADYSGRALITSHDWDFFPMNEDIEGEYLKIIENLISKDL